MTAVAIDSLVGRVGELVLQLPVLSFQLPEKEGSPGVLIPGIPLFEIGGNLFDERREGANLPPALIVRPQNPFP